MSQEDLGNPREVEEEKRGYLLFKVKGDKDRLALPWSKNWKIPRNAIIGLGILSDKKKPIVIAFSPGLPGHASLELAIAHIDPDCDYLSAFLRSYKGHSVLTIQTLTEEDKKKAEESGHIVKNPIEILTDADLKVITEALGAHEYNFAVEARHVRAIHQPLSGIDSLRRKLQTTSGD